LGLLASPALAQQSTQSEHHPGGTMPSQAMPGGGSMMGQGGIPMIRMMMDEGGSHDRSCRRAAACLAQTELKITDAQLPLWNTFAHEGDIAVCLTLERREFSRTQSPRCASGRLSKHHSDRSGTA
jgi:hypothetical protein